MNSLQSERSAAKTSSAISNIQKETWHPWEPKSQDRIMILAPHPDDETLAAGGVLAAALSLGNQSEIRVIVATNGDASYATAFWRGSHLITQKNFQHLAALRQHESLTALASLGLKAEHVHFWGYPDRGLTALWEGQCNTSHPYRSVTTGYIESVQALNSPVLPYSGAGLDQLLANELLDFRPTILIMPHPQDHHSDHSALSGFTLLAVKQQYLQKHLSPPKLFAYWMWGATKPWPMGARPSDISTFLLEESLFQEDVRRFMLKPDIRQQKARALQCYPSQKISAGKLFREAALRKFEAFTLLPLTV